MTLRRGASALLCAAVVTGCGGGGHSGGTSPPAPATPQPPQVISTPSNGHVDWPTFGYDATRSGKNPSETTLAATNVASLHTRWSYTTAGPIVAQPVVAANVDLGGTLADVLYVGDEAGGFYAVNATTGALVWKQTFPVEQNSCTDLPSWGITSTAVIDRTRHGVYVVDGQGAVHGLDLATGKALSSWPAGVPVLRDPSHEYVYSALTLSASGSLYVADAGYCDAGTYYGAVVALDASTGAPSAKWIPQSGSNIGNGIWGAGGVVADPRASVTDVYVATGNAFPEDATYSDSVVRLNANLAPVATSLRFDPTNPDNDFGASPVTFRAPGCPPQLAVAQKLGLFYLYNLDSIGAGPVQVLKIGDPVSDADASPASYDAATNMIFVANDGAPDGSYVQGLLAFSISNCTLRLAWQRSGLQSYSASQPVIANGVVYFATGNGGSVVAFNAVTGAPLWSPAHFGGPAYAAPTVVNAMVYRGVLRSPHLRVLTLRRSACALRADDQV